MDFQKQHHAAMALYKAYPKTPYFMWAIMSLLVKAKYESAEIAQKITLPLAERMTTKFIAEHLTEGEQEMQLYTMVLLQQVNLLK
jgi:hypothetical protein